MKSTHARGLLITACGVLIISPDGLLTHLNIADHWTMIFWRSIFVSFGLLLLLESVLGPVWVWLALGDQPGNSILIGGAIVLSTLAINTIWALRYPQLKPAVQTSPG